LRHERLVSFLGAPDSALREQSHACSLLPIEGFINIQ
jgi:hypothetical protein